MTRDELEFLISGHLDGRLTPAEAARLRGAVDGDPRAGALLASHQRLDDALRESRSPIDIDPDWLATRIAAHLDDAEIEPARSFRLSVGRWSTPLAAAASLAIGLAAGAWLTRGPVMPQVGPTVADRTFTEAAVTSGQVARVDVGPTATQVPDRRFAAVSIEAPANLTPAVMSSLFLVQDAEVGRVDLRPAGRPANDGFD